MANSFILECPSKATYSRAVVISMDDATIPLFTGRKTGCAMQEYFAFPYILFGNRQHNRIGLEREKMLEST